MAAAVVAAVALIGALVLATRDSGERARRDEVVRVAERFAVGLSSYDHRRLTRDVSGVRSLGVGNFRSQYDEVLGGDAFRKALRENQAIATARIVVGPLIADLGRLDARTFTVVEQRITGKSSPTPQVRKVRVESILVRTVDGWKVDWVETT